MKKIIRIFLIVLAALIIIPISALLIFYNTLSFPDPDVKAVKGNLKYFEEDYNTSRVRFRLAAQKLKRRFRTADIGTIKVPGKVDKDLTCDYCYLPQKGAKGRLLVISTGVHGVEGFASSAIQRMFMAEIAPDIDLKDMGIMLIHAVNPYGFKYLRRVSENNVDINRNSSVSADLYSTKNEGYAQLYSMLNPQGKAQAKGLGNFFFPVRAVGYIIIDSLPVLRQAVLQGQYQFPEGVYFGGKEQEPQILAIQALMQKKCSGYASAVEIDIHTGYGKRCMLHVLANPPENKQVREDTAWLFRGYKIDWGDSADFYTVNGDFTDFMGELLQAQHYIPMTFEFGTVNNTGKLQSIWSLQTMIIENRGVHYGYKSDKDKQAILKRIREQYYPSSPIWRSEVMRRGREMLSTVVKRFREME